MAPSEFYAGDRFGLILGGCVFYISLPCRQPWEFEVAINVGATLGS